MPEKKAQGFTRMRFNSRLMIWKSLEVAILADSRIVVKMLVNRFYYCLLMRAA